MEGGVSVFLPPPPPPPDLAFDLGQMQESEAVSAVRLPKSALAGGVLKTRYAGMTRCDDQQDVQAN